MIEIPPELLKELTVIDRNAQRVAVLFSGGVDSQVLLTLMRDLLGADRVLALTVDSELLSYLERDLTRRVCRQLGVEHSLLRVALLDCPGVSRNGPDRCYHCKRAMCESVLDHMSGTGCEKILDGTNADDLLEYRPGLEALREAGVESPFAAAGISGTEVREIGQRLEVEAPLRPAQSCLATRIAVGRQLVSGELALVERLETEIRREARGKLRLRLAEDEADIQFEDLDSELVEQHRDWLMEELIAAGIGLIRFSRHSGPDAESRADKSSG